MPDDLAILISFDVEHRIEQTIDAVFNIRLADQSMTCSVPVPLHHDMCLPDMERAARDELAERLRALADALQAKNQGAGHERTA